MIKKTKFNVLLPSLILLLSMYPNNVTGQDLSEYKKDMVVHKGDTLPYRILLPLNYNPNVKYPLILFLHGSGERGNDNNLQLTHGADLFLKESVRQEYPAVIVFPQLAKDHQWTYLVSDQESSPGELIYPIKKTKVKHQELLKVLIKTLKKNFNLDKNRFYVGGLSLGGMGTFEIVNQNPKMFAAAFPICGGANPEIATRINKPSWWIFHGVDDVVVPARYSQQMYDALIQVGADVKLSMYPGVNHDSWTNAFAEPDLLKWLFSKSLK